MHAYSNGNIEAARRQCEGANSSSTLPIPFRAFYTELIKTIETAKTAADEHEQAARTEDLANAMIVALESTDGAEDDDKAGKRRVLEDVIGKARHIRNLSMEEKPAANGEVMKVLVRVVEVSPDSDGDEKDSNPAQR
jgi:hypothetical protein